MLGTNIAGFSYAQTAANGADLRFTTTNAIELAYEIERWNTSGRSYVWVRLPALASRSDAFRAYWGNSSATAPAYATNGAAWEPGYAAVWHMTEANIMDSTTNRNAGAGVGVTSATGLVGVCQSTGTNRYITISALANDISGTNLEISALINTSLPDGSANGEAIVAAHVSTATKAGKVALQVGPVPPGHGELCVVDGASSVEADTNRRVDDAAWHHVFYTRSGTAGRVYIDGAYVTNHVANFTLASTDLWSIGQRYAGPGTTTRFFVGRIDEVRVSDVLRSPAWIKACSDMMLSNDTFLNYGSVEHAPVTGTTIFGW